MFWTFVSKEFKSIVRDPKLLIAMIVIPLVFLGILYLVLGHSIRQQVEEAVRASGAVSVLDLDKGTYSEMFIAYLRSLGLDVELVEGVEPLDPSSIVRNINTKVLYVIPKGFSANISNLEPAMLYIYVRIESITIGEGGVATIANNYVKLFNRNLISAIAKERGIPEKFLEGAIIGYAQGVLGDRLIEDPQRLLSTLAFGNIFIPLILITLISLSTQLVATSIAVEKEEKMFETLLSLPLSRMNVVGAKLLVSILISLVFFVAYGIMMFRFLFEATFGAADGAVFLGIHVSRAFVLPMVLNSIGLVILMTSVAMILGLLVEDVRSAQAVVGNLVLPAVVLLYMPLFIDVATPSARMAISLIPMANTIFLAKLVIIEDLLAIVLASTSNIVYGSITLLLIKRIVNSEAVFTLRLHRRRSVAQS